MSLFKIEKNVCNFAYVRLCGLLIVLVEYGHSIGPTFGWYDNYKVATLQKDLYINTLMLRSGR